MVGLVIGLGEVGSALKHCLSTAHKTLGFDRDKPGDVGPFFDVDIIHICIPYSSTFLAAVHSYLDMYRPRYVVVHSSLPVGTCAKIQPRKVVGPNTVVFHSPVRGSHPDMKRGLMTFVKYLASDTADGADFTVMLSYFTAAGFKMRCASNTKTTELMKLLELSRYGVYLAFAKEQEAICQQFGVSYDEAYLDFERTSNDGLREEGRASLQQPLLTPFQKYIGGHCTLENMALLLSQGEFPMVRQAYTAGRGTVIWGNCNIYPGVVIGKGCSVGQFTEIDDGVIIGNDVRIGAFCFIPSGVTIHDGAFIAPRVSFSNDKHPPSKKACWGKITIGRRAVVGMGAIILPGVTVGEDAVIGAGAVVTKDVPAGAVWYGKAAEPHGDRGDIYRPEEALT